MSVVKVTQSLSKAEGFGSAGFLSFCGSDVHIPRNMQYRARGITGNFDEGSEDSVLKTNSGDDIFEMWDRKDFLHGAAPVLCDWDIVGAAGPDLEYRLKRARVR